MRMPVRACTDPGRKFVCDRTAVESLALVAEIDRYRELLQAARDAGISTWVTAPPFTLREMSALSQSRA